MDTLKKVRLTARRASVECVDSVAKLFGENLQAYGWARPFARPQVQYIIPFNGGFEVVHHSHVERCEYLEQDDPVDEIPGLDDPAGVTNRADHRVKLTQQTAGTHYQGALQPFEVVLAWGLNYWEGNVVKYLRRHKEKNGKQDLQKARDYLDFLITNYEKVFKK